MISERWVVRRLESGRWEARHAPGGSVVFDNMGDSDFETFELALASVPIEFCEVIGPRDPAAQVEPMARVACWRHGDWDKALRAAGIDPTYWRAGNAGHWRRDAGGEARVA